MIGSSIVNSVNETAKIVAENTEKVIMSGIQDLVKRGLLVVETGPIKFTKRVGAENHEIEVHQEVNLVLKDQQYIEQLENENKKLKEIIQDLKLFSK